METPPRPTPPEFEPAAPTGRSVWLPRTPAAVSLAVSIAIHAAIAVTALVVVWTVTIPPRESRPDITVSFFDPAPSGVVLTEAPIEPLTSENAAPPISQPPPPVSPPAPTEPPQSPTLSDQIAAGAPREAGIAPSDRPPAPAVSRGDLMKAAPAGEVKFGGLGAGNAQSIVYIVDASGSMVTMFARVKDDLKRSLFKLAPAQQFQVVFFTKGDKLSAPHPADPPGVTRQTRLIRATRENIRAVAAWIDAVRPAGAGNPIPALETALSLRPDAAFVLSSVIPGQGAWKPDRAQVLARLDELNPRDGSGKRPIVIKTIQYLDADPEGILQAIAEAHGGKDGYNFIKRSDLPQ